MRKDYQVEIRKHQCKVCFNSFWVDCDGSDYPGYCPFCGDETHIDEFIRSKSTSVIAFE